MRVPCECGQFTVETDDANVVINGVPRCPPWTCDKVKEHRNLRRVPFSDEDEADRVAEPYAKNTRYSDI